MMELNWNTHYRNIQGDNEAIRKHGQSKNLGNYNVLYQKSMQSGYAKMKTNLERIVCVVKGDVLQKQVYQLRQNAQKTI